MSDHWLSTNSVRDLDRLADVIADAQHMVAMTGAGISVPSGIPDFRSADGLYSTDFGKFPSEQVLSRTFFDLYKAEFFDFYRSKMIYPSAKPNAAHILLAKLEEEGVLSAVVTQNIDGLHQKAGSRNVLELHGTVHSNRCMKCGKHFSLDELLARGDIPRCDCGGVIKPDVVLYEEALNGEVVSNAVDEINSADVMLIIGTSLQVYPAAGFVEYFHGDALAIINKDETDFDSLANFVIAEDCATVAEYLAKKLNISLA